MKRIALTISAVTIFLLSCNNSADSTKTDKPADTSSSEKMSDAKKTAAVPVAVDSATMMKNWMTYSTPTAIHKMMSDWKGEWNINITAWETASAAPMTSTGKSIN